MPRFHLGTMGFGYKDWEGGFYPQKATPKKYLRYYSRVFDAVEIDSTFYGSPPEKRVRRWADVTPDGFCFSLKTPKRITHDLALVNAVYEMEAFLQVANKLGSKLGVVLIQLPPSFRQAQKQSLATFLEELFTQTALASKIRMAVEFRHASWYNPQTAQLLQRYGVAWTATEYPGLPVQITKTAPFLYLRWIGHHGRFPTHRSEKVDKSDQLRAWWEKVKQVANQVEDIFGYFNNDYAGFAPATCNRFKKIAGLPTAKFETTKQIRLL